MKRTRLDLRQSARRRDDLTLKRLDTLLPRLMSEHEIDCWVISSREYADDAVAMTMLPADWFSTRRRTILVFLETSDGPRRLSVARYDLGEFFETAWDPETQPDQWEALAELLRSNDPRTIAVDVSEDFAHGDALTHGEYERLLNALGSDLASRVVSSDPLSISWLETRLPEEKQVMATACAEAHSILRRALSPEVIRAGITTTEDVVWWLRGAVQDLGTEVWFQPTVSIQRPTAKLRGSFAGRPAEEVIEPGDIVHIDFGIVWDDLCTDQQQHGYVVLPGEASPPQWINDAISIGNRMQDHLTGAFVSGKTGNQVLAEALAAGRSDGIDGVVYTHPIGFHGHGAGPTIGLWDNQEAIPGAGERLLRPDTAWSIELMVKVRGWMDRTVSIMLEEDAWFDGDTVEYLDGRQTGIWVI